MRGADVGSDHNLIIIKRKPKLHKVQGKSNYIKRIILIENTKCTCNKGKFSIELKNRFSALTENEESMSRTEELTTKHHKR